MENVQALVEQLGSDDQAQDFKAYHQLLMLVGEAGAPGQDSQRAELAQALATALTAATEHQDNRGNKSYSPKYSADVRGRVARLLSNVGSDDQVPALKQALEAFDTREMARWALDRMTGQAATDALVTAAVEGVGPEYRVGAIGALGRRKGDDVVAALKKCAADEDQEVRLAALEALSNQADPSSDELYVAVLESDSLSPRARCRTLKARLCLAATLAQANQADEARRIYEATAAGSGDAPQVEAARRALEAMG